MANQITLYLSSNPDGGATASADKSSFNVILNQPIDLSGRKNIRVALFKSEIPYTWVNISVALNNNTIQVENNNGVFNVVFQNGTYGLDDLNEALSDAILDNPATGITNPSYIPYFEGVGATGHVWLNIPSASSALLSLNVNFSASSMATILGFAPVDILNAYPEISYTLSNDIARLNEDITDAYIVCSFATGNYINGVSASGIIASISPGNISVGQTIEYMPNHLLFSTVANDIISDITIRLVRFNNQPMQLLDYYSVVLLITYD